MRLRFEEKKKVRNISVILNSIENETLENFLEQLKDENGRKGLPK